MTDPTPGTGSSRHARRRRARSEFDTFVAENARGLLRCAYLVVWDLPAAEDLVQESLLRVARRWPKVRGMEHPGAYARKVLLNLALEGAPKRHRARHELVSEGSEPVNSLGDSPSLSAVHAIEQRSELQEALAQLAPRQRAALVLRYLEDMSEAQAAAVLGCSVGTIKNTTWHALERVRQLMAHEAKAGPLAQAASPGPGRSW